MKNQGGEEARLFDDIREHLEKSSSIEGFADMMIGLFHQTIPRELSLLKVALLQDQIDQVKLILHRLKPTAKVYGRFYLHDLIANTEESVNQNGLCDKNKLIVENIIHQFEQILYMLSKSNK